MRTWILLPILLLLAGPAWADYKVWRTADGALVGFTDANEKGFLPGGDLSTYRVTIEKDRPALPPSPPSKTDILKKKLDAALADPTTSQTVKDALDALKATLP